MIDLGIAIDERDGSTIVTVSGEVDMATAPQLRERLHGLLAEGHTRLVVDLDGVAFLDSTALGVLVGSLKRARSAGGDLVLVCTVPQIRRVLEITRLDQAFTTYDSVTSALAG